MSYYFHLGAEADHFEAIAFYESRQIGLGAAYLAEFEEIMVNVVSAVHRYRIKRKPNIRDVSLKQFPFTIIFREVGGDVQVLAVAHKRRRPDYWVKRI